MLYEPTTGYQIALPSVLAWIASAGPAYDVLIQLRDVPVELGSRIDLVENPQLIPESIAAAMVLAYS